MDDLVKKLEISFSWEGQMSNEELFNLWKVIGGLDSFVNLFRKTSKRSKNWLKLDKPHSRDGTLTEETRYFPLS